MSLVWLLVVGLVLGILHHPRSSLSIYVITNYPTVQIQWYHQSILSHVLILFNEDNPKIFHTKSPIKSPKISKFSQPPRIAYGRCPAFAVWPSKKSTQRGTGAGSSRVEAPVQKSRCHWRITCCSFSKQHQVGGETLKKWWILASKNMYHVSIWDLWFRHHQTIVRFYDMLILPDMNRELWRIWDGLRVVSVGASHVLEWKQPRQPGEFG